MPRLWAVTIYVYSISDAVEFYGDVLGLHLVERNDTDGLAVFDLGGIPLLLRMPEVGEEWRHPEGGPSLFIEVEDLEKVASRIPLSKGRLVFGPETTAANQVNMGVEDPFGNQLVLTSSLKD
jgi:catechol 2,3-dioxygenase-like lactoylglutathione lyase family enzyme